MGVEEKDTSTKIKFRQIDLYVTWVNEREWVARRIKKEGF